MKASQPVAAAAIEQVACDVCFKEIPLSQATVPESTDYVVHFCGLECYARWKAQQPAPDETGPLTP